MDVGWKPHHSLIIEPLASQRSPAFPFGVSSGFVQQPSLIIIEVRAEKIDIVCGLAVLQKQRVDSSANRYDSDSLTLAVDVVCHCCQGIEEGLPIEFVISN